MMKKCSVCILIPAIILCSIIGSIYLSRSQLFDNKYEGTLINTRITPYSKHTHHHNYYHCSYFKKNYICSTDDGGNDDTHNPPPFYVVEIFQKNNSSDICELTRLTYYNTANDAYNAEDKVQLNTTRTIWSYYGNRGQCYDETIKTYNFKVGIILLSFSGFAILLVTFLIFILFENDRQYNNNQYNNVYNI